MRRKKDDDLDNIEEYEEYEEVTDQEQELIDSYMDKEINDYIKEKEKKENKLRKENEKILQKELEENIEEYEIEDDFEEVVEPYFEEKSPKSKKSLKTIIKVVVAILLILVILAVIDITCVTKWNKGPYFAIPIHTYDDGGTKEYIGFGYKVIKYNQVQGRRDTEIGTWTLKYNVNPIYIDALDLAIEFNDDEESAYKKYNKQLLVVTGSLKEIDRERNKVVISFDDEDGKYSLDVVCYMEIESFNPELLEENYEITAMGSMFDYYTKTDTSPATIHMSNCFAEQ